jgi:hypothetical protein
MGFQLLILLSPGDVNRGNDAHRDPDEKDRELGRAEAKKIAHAETGPLQWTSDDHHGRTGTPNERDEFTQFTSRGDRVNRLEQFWLRTSRVQSV